MLILCIMFVIHVCPRRNRAFSLRLVLILFCVVALLLLCRLPRESSCFMSLALVRHVRFPSSCLRRNSNRILPLLANRRPRFLARDSCLGASMGVLSSSLLMTPLVKFFVRFVLGSVGVPQRRMFSHIACLVTPRCHRDFATLRSPSICKPCRSPTRPKLFETLRILQIVIGSWMFSLCRFRFLRRSSRFPMCVASPGPFVCLGAALAFLPSLCRAFPTCMKSLVLRCKLFRVRPRCRRLPNITFSRMARTFPPASIKRESQLCH